MSRLDPRIHPYRPGLAARHLKGLVEAERFVEGTAHRVIEMAIDILGEDQGTRVTQALYGETFTVYERDGFWAWGQLETDGYVGWISKFALAPITDDSPDQTHRVCVPLTRGTSDTIKTLGYGPLPMGARVCTSGGPLPVRGSSADFLASETGTIPAAHLVALDARLADPAGIAETFLGSPYVWGGRTAMGLDCSALVQLAFQAAGLAAPRDSDQQEADFGAPLDEGTALRRGDLVFWRGHVGIMLDPERLLHANAFRMAVAIEPLETAANRILAGGGGPITARKRVALPD